MAAIGQPGEDVQLAAPAPRIGQQRGERSGALRRIERHVEAEAGGGRHPLERADVADGDARRFLPGLAIELDGEQRAAILLTDLLDLGRDIVVEAARDELARGVRTGRHHVAAAARRGAPARILDQRRHRHGRRRGATAALVWRLLWRRGQRAPFGEAARTMRLGEMAITVGRMRGEIETECILLLRHLIGERPVLRGGQADRLGRRRLAAEEAVLVVVAIAVRGGGVGEDRFRAREHGGAIMAQHLERAASGKAFELAAVEQTRIDAVREILERLEGASLDPLGTQFLHRALAHALERA